MFGQKFFPYSTLQELNLDWILTKVKNILRFVPDDGAVGQILRRTKDGAEWSDEQGGGGAVNSVNGQTGTVVLDASDVGALPDSYTAPVTSVNTKTGAVVLDKTDVGLGNVANVAQYSASNPPPYPVTSVNGQTGDVVVADANTSGSGYCKMPDGTLICWGDFTTNRSQYSMSGFGSMYAADVNLNIVFAQTFIAAPSISVICTNNGCPIMWASADASSLVHMQSMRHVNNGPPDGSTWRYTAIGRWKA